MHLKVGGGVTHTERKPNFHFIQNKLTKTNRKLQQRCQMNNKCLLFVLDERQ
jgi:hypothetical protein